jgi:hypothetical protein
MAFPNVPQAYLHAAHSSVVLPANTSVKVLSASPYTLYILFANDGPNKIYLSFNGPATVGLGIPIVGGDGSYEVGDENLYQGDVYAISQAGSTLLITVGS